MTRGIEAKGQAYVVLVGPALLAGLAVWLAGGIGRHRAGEVAARAPGTLPLWTAAHEKPSQGFPGTVNFLVAVSPEKVEYRREQIEEANPKHGVARSMR
jgi:hypothetical protein